MSFFENLSETLAAKGKEAAETAKKMAEIANIKGQISAINTEIKKNYSKIGEAYYNIHKDSELTCEFEEYVQSVRDAEKAVKELEKRISTLKGTIKCEGCGNEIDVQSTFCPKCGIKVEVDFFDEEDEDDNVSEVVTVEAGILEDLPSDGLNLSEQHKEAETVKENIMPETSGGFDVSI